MEGPLLLLAGAGSGKTRVITHRMAHLIQAHRVPGPAIVAVTFTNKAADEMRQRVNNLLGGVSSREAPLVSTFHSFCVRSLRRDGARLADIRSGFTPKFTIYDEDDQLALVKSIFKATGLDEKFIQYRAMCSWISHQKSHKHSPEDAYGGSTDDRTERMSSVYRQYEERLRQANALDFDDLLLESVRLLSHDEDLRRQYNRRFEFVMIDEYQDTNRSQYELMRLLTEMRKNVAVVGDEDQSIYGWRGADIRNILDFERDYPNATVIRLEQNYRSTKNILEAASAVVANNEERKGKWLWTEAGTGDRIGRYEAFDGEQEALFIADTIERLLSVNPRHRVAVLYRTNFQSRQIEEALRRYGRKYIVVGGFSFYQRAEVKEALAYVRLISHPEDDIALVRVLNVPPRGIGKITIAAIRARAGDKGLSMWEAVADSDISGSRSSLTSFRQTIETLQRAVAGMSPAEMVRTVLDKTGYLVWAGDQDRLEGTSRTENLLELVNAIAEATEQGQTLQDVMDQAALVADADGFDEDVPISLMTLHSAKGLEFDHVYLAGLEEGLLPHNRSLADAASIEEERRLCYVGMTRARKTLTLTRAVYRRIYGNEQLSGSSPSRFLGEIPVELIELAGGRALLSFQGATSSDFDPDCDYTERMRRGSRGGGTSRHSYASSSRPPSSARTRSADEPPALATRRRAAATSSLVGQRVRHPSYGVGTVIASEGEGDDRKFTVNFPDFGIKKLVERYARLELA